MNAHGMPTTFWSRYWSDHRKLSFEKPAIRFGTPKRPLHKPMVAASLAWMKSAYNVLMAKPPTMLHTAPAHVIPLQKIPRTTTGQKADEQSPKKKAVAMAIMLSGSTYAQRSVIRIVTPTATRVTIWVLPLPRC